MVIKATAGMVAVGALPKAAIPNGKKKMTIRKHGYLDT